MGRKKKYNTEEEKKAAQREANRRWKEKNPDYMKQYMEQYNKTPIGRASNLLQGYRQSDKKYDRGECTLTAQWIIDNIFPKPCAHCGKTGWDKLGCNRIDNSLPHTPDNVEPCCEECNKKVPGRSKKVLRAKETTL